MNNTYQNKKDSIESIQELTYELMSAFNSGLFWLVEYCEKNNLPIPDLERARSLITTSSFVLENSEFAYQPKGNTENDQPPSTQSRIF